MNEKKQRPVQIRLDVDAWKILKVYAASQDKTANEVIADLATSKAEEVKQKVAPVLP